MKYNETKLTFDDLIKLLTKHTEFVDDEERAGGLWIDYADTRDRADCEIEGYPVFLYFDNLDGKKYVLEENEANDCSVVYEVTEIDEGNEWACNTILRETISMWDGDAYENLALYNISANPVEASEGDVDVRIWVEFNYSYSTINKPLDRYVRNIDFDIKRRMEPDAYEAHEFSTYQDADAWINKQVDNSYTLSHGEMDRPDYIIVS